jgi:putative lipoprotein
MNMFHAPTIIAALLLAAATPLALAAQQTPPPATTPPAATGNTATITGSAMYRERIAMPPGAVFTATLEDTSRADAPATRIAQYTKRSPGNPPIHFTITYDPAKIVDSHTYTVRATITVDGRLMFTSTTSNPVLTNGKPDHVAFTLHHVTPADDTPAVASRNGTAPAALEDSYWKLVTLHGKDIPVIPNHREPSLILHPEGMRTEVFGGCNEIAGTYKLKGSSLIFGPMAGTLMACPETADTESAFTRALQETTTYHIYGQHLDLIDANHTVVARFEWRVMK